MKTFIQRAIILAIVIIATTSCVKKDNPAPIVAPPVMTEISISGESLVYNITIFFNEGVYANHNKTGDLTRNNLSVVLASGETFIVSYIVTHSACQKNANIRVVLNKEPSINEVITVQPTSCFSIYNFNGIGMCSTEKLSISIDGT